MPVESPGNTSSKIMDKCAETSSFFLNGGLYARQVSFIWFSRNWWWLVLPVVTTLFLSLWHSAMIYVSIILVFMFFPALISIAFFKHALSPLAVSNIYLQKYLIYNSRISRIFIPDERYDKVPPEQSYNFSEIKHAVISGRYLTITLSSSQYDMLIIPLNVFSKDSIEFIYELFGNYGMDFAEDI